MHSRPKNQRVGRGGKRGKTSGRGGKGQTARAGAKMRPEMRDIIKKLPKRRGYGKNRGRTVFTMRPRPVTVDLSSIEAVFNAGAEITPKVLLSKGLVERHGGRVPSVKIIGGGEGKKFLIVDCEVSEGAKKVIEKAGGKIS